MARNTHRQTFAQETARLAAERQRTRTMDPAARADLDRRSSGAHGAHSDSKSRNVRAAGRTNRVGSRSSQRHAAVRDYA